MKNKEEKITVTPEKDTNWGKPKQIRLPKAVNDFLFNVLEEHLKETNEKFGNLLDESKEEKYNNHGEFLEIDKETKTVYLFVRAGKSWTEPI